MTVSNILDEMQTHSLNDVSGVHDDTTNVVQGAAIFFTECECKNHRGHSSKEEISIVDNSTSQQPPSLIKDEQRLKGILPGSPVDDLMDSDVKTEDTLPINVSNTIVSPLTHKRGSK